MEENELKRSEDWATVKESLSVCILQVKFTLYNVEVHPLFGPLME